MLGLLGDLNLSESLTETGQSASLDRYEFANRLANQHSALGSLGQVQTGVKPEMTGKDSKIQTGTLEGLEEIREVIDANSREEKSENSTKIQKEDSQIDQSQSESIFSDASKSDTGSKLFDSESESKSEKSQDFQELILPEAISEKSKSDKSRSEEKSYSESFEKDQSSEGKTENSSESEESKNEDLLFAFDLKPAKPVNPPEFHVTKSVEDLLESSEDSFIRDNIRISEKNSLEESRESSKNDNISISNIDQISKSESKGADNSIVEDKYSEKVIFTKIFKLINLNEILNRFHPHFVFFPIELHREKKTKVPIFSSFVFFFVVFTFILIQAVSENEPENTCLDENSDKNTAIEIEGIQTETKKENLLDKMFNPIRQPLTANDFEREGKWSVPNSCLKLLEKISIVIILLSLLKLNCFIFYGRCL